MVRATGADIVGVRSAGVRRRQAFGVRGGGAASVPCARLALRRRGRLQESGDVQPVRAHARGELGRGGGDGVAPGRGGRFGAHHQLIDEVLRGLCLDEAAQAEAHVPALVALDALDALTQPGQGAVGQVVEQRDLPPWNTTPSSSMW